MMDERPDRVAVVDFDDGSFDDDDDDDEEEEEEEEEVAAAVRLFDSSVLKCMAVVSASTRSCSSCSDAIR